MMLDSIRHISVLLLFLSIAPVRAATITKTNTFVTGAPISSSEMNTNFDQLFSEMNSKETRVSSLESNQSSLTSNLASASSGIASLNSSVSTLSSNLSAATAQISQLELKIPHVYYVSGSPYTVNVPSGATSVIIEAVGGGGGGGDRSDGGSDPEYGYAGANANYSKTILSLAGTGITTLKVIVGAGGDSGSDSGTCNLVQNGQSGISSRVQNSAGTIDYLVASGGGGGQSAHGGPGACVAGSPPSTTAPNTAIFSQNVQSLAASQVVSKSDGIPGAGGAGATWAPSGWSASPVVSPFPGQNGVVVLTFF